MSQILDMREVSQRAFILRICFTRGIHVSLFLGGVGEHSVRFAVGFVVLLVVNVAHICLLLTRL